METLQQLTTKFWHEKALPGACGLESYLSIPNLSPAFDGLWRENGYMHQAYHLLQAWVERIFPGKNIVNHSGELHGRTPTLCYTIAGTAPGNVLIYGHYDKQPPGMGWKNNRDPFTASREGDRLYGRGAADDGYALFAALGAVHAIMSSGKEHPRITILIEGSEESGSPDLIPYLHHYRECIGVPDLVICLDSGCATYDRLWVTTSLRGLVNGTLSVRTMPEGVHSGDGGGVVPSSSRISRILISRIEDMATGMLMLPDLFAVVPPDRLQQAQRLAAFLDVQLWEHFHLVEGALPCITDPVEVVLNQTWRACLETIGSDLPHLSTAGNVLRASVAHKLSVRIPPTVDPIRAAEALTRQLTSDVPYGAQAHFSVEKCSPGWNAPAMNPALADLIDEASSAFFGRTAMYRGEGGTIPFLHHLGTMFPAAQSFVTGVLGPESNAHGPNEFLHLPTAVNLTACLADILSKFTPEPSSR